jgi:hypothetical protein
MLTFDDSTARNAVESPLLRLPAELRESIWTLAFGMRTVHPRSNGAYSWKSGVKRSTYRQLSFDYCQEEFSDNEIYQMSLDGQSEESPRYWKHPNMMDPGGHIPSFRGMHICARWEPGEEELTEPRCEQLVPLVCKHIYYEATPVAWKTTTFSFSVSGYFQDFVKSTQTRLDLVTQLSIIQLTSAHDGYQQGWVSAFESTVWSNFTSLRGLNLILRNNVISIHPSTRHPCSLNVMSNPPYYSPNLPAIIRRFQSLPLIRDRTTVLVVANYWDDEEEDDIHFPITERRAMAEVVRELLLQGAVKKSKKQLESASRTEGLRRSQRLKDAQR